MSLYYLTGEKMNAFGRGTVSATSTDSISALTAVYDNDPSLPHVMDSAAADMYLQVTLNALTNPGFETSTLSGWNNDDHGTGTSTETTTAGEYRSGSKALKLVGSDTTTNYGSRYQDITVAAGEYRSFRYYLKGNGTFRLYLRNLKTGNYYSSSAWGSTRASAESVAASGSFAQGNVLYQIESFEACRADTVTLRVELVATSGTGVFVDDTRDVPGVTFAGIFGHNYGPIVPTVQSSDDGAAWTTRATMTVKRPSFFSVFSIIYAEYWRISLLGTNHEAPYTGEAVLGQYQTATTSPQWQLETTNELPGVRVRSAGLRPYVYNFSTDPAQAIKMKFSARTAAASRELADSMWLRSGAGRWPIVVVPIDTETDVIFGRITEPHTIQRPFSGVYETTMMVQGDPFPTVGL